MAEARPGCCAGHGGVCDCKCCDGSNLSATCAPHYPRCGKTSSPQQRQEAPRKADGSVVRILDGDTIEVMIEGKPARIRLHGIDCPEKNQAFGQKAKKVTAELAGGKTVKIITRDKDRYGRIVGEVILPDGRSLNSELVKAGLAWWYRQYAKNDAELERLEKEAKEAKRGLWADKEPMAPWSWRKGKR